VAKPDQKRFGAFHFLPLVSGPNLCAQLDLRLGFTTTSICGAVHRLASRLRSEKLRDFVETQSSRMWEEQMDAASRIQLEKQLRDARAEEIETRIRAHKLKVEQIRTVSRRRGTLGLAPQKMPLDFLALGDSWFEYPLTDDGLLTTSNQAIVGEAGTQLQSMGNPPPTILSYALHGQSTEAMLTYERQQSILSALTDPNTTQWNNGTTADGILVSAGGDDIAGDQFAIYLDYHGKGLDDARFQGLLASVRASYMDLFALRDIAAADLHIDPKQIPIFGHCYDYAVPNGKPAGWPIPLSGPWLLPSLNFSGYDYNQGLQIITAAIDGFRQLLVDLGSDKITLPGRVTNNFILIDTIRTLTRDNSRPNGWANELHPYTEGFTSLAGRFLAALQAHFPGKI
jgi:hypothetical protein